MMRHVYPLPTDEAAVWPRAEQIFGHNRLHLGRRILDSGLGVTWGDGQHWVEVNEPTSPRGSIWHLNRVCWLSVHATVPAPPPGCYAGFFRIRQPIQRRPLLRFSAEWKVAATMAVRPAGDDFGFLSTTDSQRAEGVRQDGEASVSWIHRQEYHEDNPGGWLLLHIGNIMVRESSEAQQSAAATEGGASSATIGTGGPAVGNRGRDVAISFGGENPNWMSNLEVDFAAIAPLRLSWDIERVLMIGNRKTDAILPPAELGQAHEEGLDRAVEAAPDDGGIGSHLCCSPLALLPHAVMTLVLEFSQPTLDAVGGPI
ncbi:unnamed protein product [Ectocarpus sp. CCAP 1310/34]|nr:unnamed protein product [Ectocarpus sp. CCAP 1310/34]